MLVIEYCSDGSPFNDFTVDKFRAKVLEKIKLDNAIIKICNITPINVVRLMICTDIINASDVMFKFPNGVFAGINEYGYSANSFPRDLLDNQLIEDLLEAQTKKFARDKAKYEVNIQKAKEISSQTIDKRACKDQSNARTLREDKPDAHNRTKALYNLCKDGNRPIRLSDARDIIRKTFGS